MAEHQFSSPAGKILVFAREPVAGHVKTRLARSIGDQAAVQFHQEIVTKTVDMAANSGLAELELHVSGNMEHPFFRSLADQYSMRICLQEGNDLGEKMFHALKKALDHASYCILIGTDCPVMTADYLKQAFHILEKGMDAVIGPAEDGGYVLIGASRIDISWFNNIDWGSQHVLAQSRQRLTASNARYEELQQLWDVDHIDDLHRWRLTSSTLN
jgi:rSAM/selenodomain-associated transferase 1